MEYDIEKILTMYEDDYNPSSKVPGPRNMYDGGQLVSNTVDGSRPGYAGNKDKIIKIKNFIGKKKKIKKTEIIKLLNDLEYPNWSDQLAKLKQRGYLDNVEIIDDYKQTRSTLKGGGSRINQVEDIFKNWKSTGKTNYTKQELIEALPEGAYEKNKKAYDTAEYKIKKNYKSIKLIEQRPDRSKPLPKSVQQKLVEAFPEIDFKFGTKAQPGYGIRKYGVSKKDIGEALYVQIQAFAKYNLEPQFPKGTTPEGKLLHQMFRSTQPGSGGGIRFQLVDKNGKVIPKEKYPKNWRKNEAYKNIRILNTETGDIIKYTDDIKGKGISMKEYINKVEKNPQAYDQALESYKLQKNISTTPYMYKGKEYTLGGTLNKNRVIENFKKEFKRFPTKNEMKNLFRSNNVGSWQVHHPEGVANNWWKSEVAFRDANMKLNYIDKNLKASLKTINNPKDKAKLIKQVSTEVKKLPGGISYIFEGQELGKPLNLKSVIEAPISQANLKVGEKITMQKSIKKLIASFGGGTCSVFSGKKAALKADGGRIGLQAGTPNLDDCFKSGSAVINSGKVPVDKADDFAQLLKRAGNIGRGIMKFGIIPEAIYATADSLVRMGMGDTFTEAGLRATDYLLPGDQTKTAEISKVSRIFGDETGELVGRTIDYKNQLAKIQSLEDQKANFENLSGGGEFDYIGDLTGDVNNVEKQLIQARNDLDNKFKISEAEKLYAESKQNDAYDASSANSFFTRLKAKYRDSSDDLDDIEQLAAPEKTQMQLNLNMLPQVPRNYMKASDDVIINYVNTENIRRGEKQDPQLYIDERDKLKKDFMTKGPGVYGKEQVYGTQGTFGGEPVDMTNYFGPANSQTSNRFGSQQRPVLYPQGRNSLGLASGGIASLTKTIPPESGPTPHGLRYPYNNVKKI